MDPEPVSPPPNEQPVGGQPVAARILPPPVPSVAHRVDLPAPRMDRDALRRAAEEMMQSTLPNVDALSHFVNILMSYNSAATGQPAGAPAWAAEIRDSRTFALWECFQVVWSFIYKKQCALWRPLFARRTRGSATPLPCAMTHLCMSQTPAGIQLLEASLQPAMIFTTLMLASSAASWLTMICPNMVTRVICGDGWQQSLDTAQISFNGLPSLQRHWLTKRYALCHPSISVLLLHKSLFL